mmetsp:Transcript_4836/g.13553  ORF Transcript_4836/g.13553 Transcript_4836/m.13553 type:complete len:306 (+) Transcript_4836:69-986(+)
MIDATVASSLLLFVVVVVCFFFLPLLLLLLSPVEPLSRSLLLLRPLLLLLDFLDETLPTLASLPLLFFFVVPGKDRVRDLLLFLRVVVPLRLPVLRVLSSMALLFDVLVVLSSTVNLTLRLPVLRTLSSMLLLRLPRTLSSALRDDLMVVVLSSMLLRLLRTLSSALRDGWMATAVSSGSCGAGGVSIVWPSLLVSLSLLLFSLGTSFNFCLRPSRCCCCDDNSGGNRGGGSKLVDRTCPRARRWAANSLAARALWLLWLTSLGFKDRLRRLDLTDLSLLLLVFLFFFVLLRPLRSEDDDDFFLD